MEQITIIEQCNLALKVANNPRALKLDLHYLAICNHLIRYN